MEFTTGYEYFMMILADVIVGKSDGRWDVREVSGRVGVSVLGIDRKKGREIGDGIARGYDGEWGALRWQ